MKGRTKLEKLLKEAATAMDEVIGFWNTPDSPEGFCYAMK